MSVITLTGPTCAGKSTIERELQRMGCGRAISHTTRPRRPGENHGEHYHFVSDGQYDALAEVGEFIETVTFGTRRYAMSKAAIIEAMSGRKHAAIVVDPHGAEQIRRFCQEQKIDAYSVWVDCGPLEQARRWVLRESANFMRGVESAGPAAERLGIMLGEEATWRVAAANRKIQMNGRYWYNQAIESATPPPEALAFSVLEGLERHLRMCDKATQQNYGAMHFVPDMSILLNRPDIR